MMLNVSQTRVPESWLSTAVAKPSVGYNALDREALATLEKSRFSVSTIDSELFPELLSWSSLINTLPASPCAQSIPSDIDTKLGDTDTVLEANLSLSLILDPTALEADFDQSCFDGLDDLLIRHPFEAFAEVCWFDAVGSSPSLPVSTPTQFLNKPTGQRKLPPPVMSPLSGEYDAGVDENLMLYKEGRIPMSGVNVISGASPLCSEQKPPRYTTDKYLSSIYDDDNEEASSFILFEAPLLTPDRFDPVGHFYMPSSRPHKNMSGRIATFCSNLPASFTYAR